MPRKPHYRLPGEAIFVVAPAADRRYVLERQLFRLGPHVQAFASGAELLAALRPDDLGCVVIDPGPGGIGLLTLLGAVREAAPAVAPVVLLSGDGVGLAPEASRAGAYQLLLDPADPGDLREAAAAALAASRERAGRFSHKAADEPRRG